MKRSAVLELFRYTIDDYNACVLWEFLHISLINSENGEKYSVKMLDL